MNAEMITAVFNRLVYVGAGESGIDAARRAVTVLDIAGVPNYVYYGTISGVYDMTGLSGTAWNTFVEFVQDYHHVVGQESGDSE